MPVYPLYEDFFRFLDSRPEDDPWPSYESLYLKPHEDFFRDYWKTFAHFDRQQIAERVRQIKKEDYGQLRSLVQMENPVEMAEEALRRCRKILPLNPEPPVYLFVGFFSADGVTVEVDGAPVIAIGLERFQDLKDLPLLVAHEYGHCAQRRHLKEFFPKEGNLLYSIIAEGLSVLLSEAAYPEIPLPRHLYLTPERWRWAKENKDAVLELAAADLASSKLIPILFGPGDPNAGLPPRLGYFVAREMLGHCLSHHGVQDFAETFPKFEELFRTILERGDLDPSGSEGPDVQK
jgi:hypothetical protein